MKKRLLKVTTLSVMLLGLASCTPYGSLNVSAPFKVGPVYVNPSIGLGGSL